MSSIDQQPFYNLPDVSKKLGNVSRSTLYRLIGQSKLVRVNLGTKALITGESLARYVDELHSTATPTPDPAHKKKRHIQKQRDTR